MLTQVQNSNYQFSNDKLFYHSDKMCSFIEHRTVYPSVYEISLSGKCSQNCIYCCCKDVKSDALLSWEDITKAVRQISTTAKALTFTGGGEPSLNPHLLRSVLYARKQGLRVGLLTNGARIDYQEFRTLVHHTSFIRFSIDSIDQDTYCRLRGSTPESYCDIHSKMELFAEYLRSSKHDSRIGIHIVWVDQSESDLEQTVQYFSRLGFDFIQIRPVDNAPYEANFLLQVNYPSKTGFLNELVSKYSTPSTQVLPNLNKFEDFADCTLEKRYTGCMGANFTASIGHDNRVYFCCSHIGDSAYEIGDLNQNTLDNILHSELRKALIENVKHDDCQFQCRNHHLNKILTRFSKYSDEEKYHIIKEYSSIGKPLHWEFL